KKQVVKHLLDAMENLADTPDAFEKLHHAYRTYLKQGLATDFEWRERLGKLVRFESSRASGDAPFAERYTSLADYVSRMKDGQDAIYYLFGESRRALEDGPHAEGLRQRGFELLFLTDPIDEWVMDSLREYGGKSLVSAMRADLKLAEKDSDKEERTKQT